MEHLAAMTGRAWRLSAGDVLQIIDLEGSQVADVFLVDAQDMTDGLSNGRTFDYGATISLSLGSELYSSNSRLLATIVRDDVGAHDFLYTPCSQAMLERQYNLTDTLGELGVPAATATVPFNVFQHTSVAADGKLTIHRPRSQAGDVLELRADRDLLAAVSACAAGVANGGGARPIGVTIRRAGT